MSDLEDLDDGEGMFEEDEEDDLDDDDDRMEISVQQTPSQLRSNLVKPEIYRLLPAVLSEYRELGDEATWTLSSAKSGNGAEALRNGETQTYWQSDGNHPHVITVQFHRRVSLVAAAMYCNIKLDESYTPKRVRVEAGNTIRDMEHVVEVELESPDGWVLIDLTDPETKRPLRTFILQIKCIAMHSCGRDTHVRAVKLFGPRMLENEQEKSPFFATKSNVSQSLSSYSGSQALSSFAFIR